jgi:hypothetical protein
MDFVFGSFQEWMGVLEHRARSTHCTLTADEWKSALEEADFSITQFLHSSSHAVAHLAFISQRAPTSRSYATILSSSIPRPIEDLETIIRYFPVEGQVELVHFMSCSLDAAKPYVVWLHTDSDANNANLVGLVRSIRHEFTLWKIYLVLFHPSWKSDQQEAYVRHRLTPLRWIDSEVTVDAKGMMLVPRIVKASPPPQTELRGSKPIGFNETQIWRTYPASLGPSDVEVSVIFINLSATSPSWTEFAGNVTAAGSNLIDQEIVGKRCVHQFTPL